MQSRFVLAALSMAGVVGGASASMIQFDVNGIRAESAGGYNGLTHTGDVVLTRDLNTTLVGVEMNGLPVAFTGTLLAFHGSVSLVGGNVVGGYYSITMSDGSRYEALFSSPGHTASQAGQGYMIDGLTISGAFSSLVGGRFFGGVDVSELANNSLAGSALLSALLPNSGGVDPNVNFEGFAFVPAPGAAGLFGLTGLAGLRRRRV